ncbi:uncharacterized protein LOC113930175 [Zalophus californianus]|uniref:Uncharacterized protein LOC113930175 n=1 Tax=Zalophus californianus TaxID=9704 RepID=A0A6J2E845_ZALCA|nr:uncharacterized protein LOC113930175 [Zalophus californianus]
MDSGPVQALQLRDQPQPASAATGSAAANGAGPGLHVTASTFPRPHGRARSGPGSPEAAAWRARWPRVGDWRREAARRQAGAWGGEDRRSPKDLPVKRLPEQGAVPGCRCRLAGAGQDQQPSPFLGLSF